LKLVNGYKNIPFSILENNLDQSNESTMLTIRLQVNYPAFYLGVEDLFDEIHDSLPNALLRINSDTNFTISMNNMIYKALNIDVGFSENLAPGKIWLFIIVNKLVSFDLVTLNKLVYDLGSEFNNTPLGIVRNQTTVTNITNTVSIELNVS